MLFLNTLHNLESFRLIDIHQNPEAGPTESDQEAVSEEEDFEDLARSFDFYFLPKGISLRESADLKG